MKDTFQPRSEGNTSDVRTSDSYRSAHQWSCNSSSPAVQQRSSAGLGWHFLFRVVEHIHGSHPSLSSIPPRKWMFTSLYSPHVTECSTHSTLIYISWWIIAISLRIEIPRFRINNNYTGCSAHLVTSLPGWMLTMATLAQTSE